MDLVILGSGTAVPVADRFPAGYLIKHDDAVIAVDLGPGVLRRLAQAGVGLGKLSDVLLTHFHTDHCADLAALLFGLRNPSFVGRPPLRIRAAAGLHDLLTNIERAWPWCRAGEYRLDIDEIGPGTLAIGALQVTAVPIVHTDASLGYRFESPDGHTIALSGDASLCDGVVELAKGVDFFVCDAAFPTALPTPGHMTASEAGQAAARAGAKILCLTHFYPECDGHDLVAEARTEFDGEVVLAQDLWRYQPSTGAYAPLAR